MGLVFNTAVLFLFCVGWYKGNILLKVFLVIQFISLRELAFLAGYSFFYIGNSLIDILVYRAGDSMGSAERLLMAVSVLFCFSVAFVETIEGVMLFSSVRKIVKN